MGCGVFVSWALNYVGLSGLGTFVGFRVYMFLFCWRLGGGGGGGVGSTVALSADLPHCALKEHPLPRPHHEEHCLGVPNLGL